MKRLLFTLLVLVLCTAFVLPPALPSSFWGYAVGIPAGASVDISAGGVTLAVAQVKDYGGVIAYAVNVTGGQDGDVLQFKYNGAVVGSGIYHVGSNQRVDLFLASDKKIKRGK